MEVVVSNFHSLSATRVVALYYFLCDHALLCRLELHVAFGPDHNMRVSEVWDSREQLQAFGDRLMPILTEIGIEFSGEPEIIEVQNIITR